MRSVRSFAARPALIDTAFFLALMAIGAVALWPIYQTPRLVVLAAVSLVAGAVLAWLGALFRWPGYAVLAAALALFIAVGVPLAVPDRAVSGVLPSFEGVRDLVASAALGWKQLVTVDLPVASYQALLVPALVLLLGGTVAGLSIVLRVRRGEFGIVAPIVVIVAGIALGSPVAWYPQLLGLSALLVSIAWISWRAWRRRRVAIRVLAGETGPDAPRGERGMPGRPAVRPAVTAVVVVALAVGAGVSAAALLPPSGGRDVVRASIERPFDPRDYASPLSGFRAFWSADESAEPLFTITGLVEKSRIRLATLDTYNGVVYSVGDGATESESGFFARVPSTVDRAGEAGTPVSASITIENYRGVWLPTVGELSSVDFAGPRSATLADAFYFNRASGAAALLGGVQPGDSYTLDAIQRPAPSDEELLSASPGTEKVPAPENVPSAVRDTVEKVAAGQDSPGEKLSAIISYVRSTGYISHGIDDSRPYSRSGHAADRITELLTAPVMLGDGEQYATAVALMADELGFPARVVLGFEPREGQNTVTGSDVSAWVEVDTDAYGWVAVDATPDDREIPEQLPDATQQVSRPQVVIPPPPASDDTPVEPNRPESDEKAQKPVDEFWPAVLAVVRIVGTAGLVLLVLAAPALAIGITKLARRRRRRNETRAAGRIAGAWNEVVDAALDYGYAVPQTATRREFAAVIAKTEVATLAVEADRAVFADDEVSPRAAAEYWRDLEALRVSWASDYTRWERLRAALSLRSLRRTR
ncbi:transglutaminase-like domain-containing protein [Agreia sp. COWG]|uniref:transglutaminase-like domain-containing protein n=1 Tax=Agreia sp. COWG TaxID=2773266 RepID=UPI00192591D5|nr:transglutaminase-like domain-containing protein [Agreia sp. COWG]CAD6004726.1 TGc domain-containing protein [Agreia sp. COWG]